MNTGNPAGGWDNFARLHCSHPYPNTESKQFGHICYRRFCCRFSYRVSTGNCHRLATKRKVCGVRRRFSVVYHADVWTMLALGPKKDGSPNVKFFESAETLAMFEGVRTWLMKNHKKVRSFLAGFCLIDVITRSTRIPFVHLFVFFFYIWTFILLPTVPSSRSTNQQDFGGFSVTTDPIPRGQSRQKCQQTATHSPACKLFYSVHRPPSDRS